MALHDKLFKQLLSRLLPEFLELFFPQVRACFDESSLTFLDKEFFTDPGTGEKCEADIVARAQLLGQDSFFIINVEGQGPDLRGFQDRFFLYSVYLYQKHHLPVYPIVVFYDKYPAAVQPQTYSVGFLGRPVFEFHYEVIQLNKLDWREFVGKPNPVATALVARMKMAAADRPIAKLETIQMLLRQGLDAALVRLISAFIDTYLDLSVAEEEVFQRELAKIQPEQREEVMELTTSWMRQGIQQGLQQGLQQGRQEGMQMGEAQLVARQLRRRLGSAFAPYQERIEQLTPAQLEDLGEALLDFTGPGDLAHWLAQQQS